MGRASLNSDQKAKPRAFALRDDDLALLDWVAEQHDFSRSRALREVIRQYESSLDGDAIRELQLRRVALRRAAREEEVLPTKVNEPTCPECGDRDLFVQLAGDRWRCDNCLATG